MDISVNTSQDQPSEMKKININDIRLMPPAMGFGFCVYGEPEDEIIDWANSWGFRIQEGKPYTNIFII